MLSRLALQSRLQSSTAPVAGAVLVAAGVYGVYSYSTSRSKPGEPRMLFAGGPVFTSLRLKSVETVNHNCKTFRFELPEENSLSGLSLTSSVLTFSRPKGSFFPVIRPYTPINDFEQRGSIDLLVKHYPNGKQSSHIHSLQPGQSLFFLAKIPGFQWTPNQFSHVTMIAGGAGITPMFQLIRGILKNPEDKTKITLVFGNNSDADILFKKEFDEFEKSFPGSFKAIYAVSNPDANSPFMKGHVTKELLEKLVEKPSRDTKVLVSGPPAMEKALLGNSGILGQLGYTKDQIHNF